MSSGFVSWSVTKNKPKICNFNAHLNRQTWWYLWFIHSMNNLFIFRIHEHEMDIDQKYTTINVTVLLGPQSLKSRVYQCVCGCTPFPQIKRLANCSMQRVLPKTEHGFKIKGTNYDLKQKRKYTEHIHIPIDTRRTKQKNIIVFLIFNCSIVFRCESKHLHSSLKL